MLKKGLSQITAILATLITSQAIAATTGWYLEGNAGTSYSTNANYGNSTKPKNSANLALNIDLGYKFMPYFATELGYTVYTNSKMQDSSGATQAKVLQYSFDIAGKAILPFQDSGFELFTKLGGSKIRTKVISTTAGINKGSHGATGLYIGIGAGYSHFTNTTFLLQWQRAIGNSTVGNFDLYSVGVAYLFG